MDDEGFSLWTAVPRALVAAVIGAVGYLVTLWILDPHRSVFDHLFLGDLSNYIGLGMALPMFGAVFWRLMKGASMGEEIGKTFDIDLD